MKACKINGCDKKFYGREMCKMHYLRWYRHGDVNFVLEIRDGRALHPYYGVYKSMLTRCFNKSFKQWKDYGGRGITVCDEWRTDFWAWLEHMGPRPEGYVIDRIDNDGNYEPSNVKWSSRKESQNNRRCSPKYQIKETA